MPVARILAPFLFVAMSFGVPAQTGTVRQYELPVTPEPCPVWQLPTGAVWYAPTGDLYIIVYPAYMPQPSFSHVLWGVEQIGRPEWHNEQIRLSGEGLHRWHVALLTGSATVSTLDLPKDVYAVRLPAGSLEKMPPETWARPVAKWELRVWNPKDER